MRRGNVLSSGGRGSPTGRRTPCAADQFTFPQLPSRAAGSGGSSAMSLPFFHFPLSSSPPGHTESGGGFPGMDQAGAGIEPLGTMLANQSNGNSKHQLIFLWKIIREELRDGGDHALQGEEALDEALGEERVNDLLAAVVADAEGELQRERADAGVGGAEQGDEPGELAARVELVHERAADGGHKPVQRRSSAGEAEADADADATSAPTARPISTGPTNTSLLKRTSTSTAAAQPSPKPGSPSFASTTANTPCRSGTRCSRGSNRSPPALAQPRGHAQRQHHREGQRRG
uniref:Uncharacterized protein n=1 Tax=Oryza meridionalis TaxID=40149 RepID=A0A0E0ECN0_9ORYZ